MNKKIKKKKNNTKEKERVWFWARVVCFASATARAETDEIGGVRHLACVASPIEHFPE